jgi:hypothetical protein
MRTPLFRLLILIAAASSLAFPIVVNSQPPALSGMVDIPKARQLLKEYPTVLFSILSQFPYDYTPTRTQPIPEARIPASIRALNGKNISIRGFMVPIDFQDDGVRSFIVVPNGESCCYGVMMGAPNEWVEVQMTGTKKVEFPGPAPIIVFGKLQVKEEMKKAGIIERIYTMQGEAMSVVLNDELPWPTN